jgi:chemotaxis protein methyltransferase CheR
MKEQDYIILRDKLFALTKLDLDSYKSQQMRRRLAFYMETRNENDIYSFCKKLENDAEALHKLLDYITINVTEFFRDEWAFKELQKNIIPALIQRNPNKLRIWSAGCSNGGEPYSLAMLLREITGSRNHYILATDFDEMSLLKAKSGGPYTQDALKGVPSDFVKQYMKIEGEHSRMHEDITSMVKFQQHNMLSDGFEENFDLICCRNVTIYFTKEAQESLYQRFNHALKFAGVLFIGATEFVTTPGAFGFVKLGTCFYQKTSTSLVTGQETQKEAVLQLIKGGK